MCRAQGESAAPRPPSCKGRRAKARRPPCRASQGVILPEKSSSPNTSAAFLYRSATIPCGFPLPVVVFIVPFAVHGKSSLVIDSSFAPFTYSGPEVIHSAMPKELNSLFPPFHRICQFPPSSGFFLSSCHVQLQFVSRHVKMNCKPLVVL